MSKLSAYVLTFNEEGKIRDALESIKWVDEIVVLDSHSTDRTEQICKEYTDRFYQCDFEGFGKLRNRALDLVTHDWVLSIDADERASSARRFGPSSQVAHGLMRSLCRGRISSWDAGSGTAVGTRTTASRSFSTSTVSGTGMTLCMKAST